MGMIECGQNSRPQKIPGPKINPPKLRRIQSEGDFFFVGRGVEILKFPVTSNLIVQ